MWNLRKKIKIIISDQIRFCTKFRFLTECVSTTWRRETFAQSLLQAEIVSPALFLFLKAQKRLQPKNVITAGYALYTDCTILIVLPIFTISKYVLNKYNYHGELYLSAYMIFLVYDWWTQFV